MERKDFESIPNFKCFFKCMMEKDGILRNETFSQERFEEVLKEDEELTDSEREKSIKALPICLDESKFINDLCNKSFTITFCLYKILN